MTVEEAVARGTANMAAAETACQTVQKKLATLPAVFATVRDGGVSLGGLETMELSAEAKALAGLAANLELEIVTFHRKLTARAVELGVELPGILSGSR